MSHGKYLTPEVKEQIVTLYKTGITMREVADRLGVSQSAVSRVIKASGYDRFHVGSRLAKSLPNIPAPAAAKPTPEPARAAFTTVSRTLKLVSNTTGCSYEISTDSDIVQIESDVLLGKLEVAQIDAFIADLQHIKSQLGIPS